MLPYYCYYYYNYNLGDVTIRLARPAQTVGFRFDPVFSGGRIRQWKQGATGQNISIACSQHKDCRKAISATKLPVGFEASGSAPDQIKQILSAAGNCHYHEYI